MEARELRLGNLVLLPDDTVIDVGPALLRSIILSGKNNKFKPIPLTEQRLLNFGYIPCDLTKNHFNIVGHRIWKCNDMFLCEKTGVILDYVHSLQNLFFALNKKELTIKQTQS